MSIQDKIREFIEEIFVISGDREDWHLDSKVCDRMRWIKSLENIEDD